MIFQLKTKTISFSLKNSKTIDQTISKLKKDLKQTREDLRDNVVLNNVTVDKFYVNAIINLKGNGSSSKDLVQKNIPAGTDYENIITADHGKKITSIKVDGKEILTKEDLKTNIIKYNFNYKLIIYYMIILMSSITGATIGINIKKKSE